MTGDDRTVQVPVSLPTREQIAQALDLASDGQETEATWAELMLIMADAVLAMLSPPTATAEPACGVSSPHAAHRVDPAPGDDFFECAGTATYWHDPEPPRIEDMAPGTTFTGRLDIMDGLTDRRVFMRVDGVDVVDDAGARWHLQDIDPYTIRDVTQPKDV